jgi:hypothetical protein
MSALFNVRSATRTAASFHNKDERCLLLSNAQLHYDFKIVCYVAGRTHTAIQYIGQ